MSDSNVTDLKPAKKPKADPKPATAEAVPIQASPEPEPEQPAPEPLELIYCMMCKHWLPSAPVRPAMHSAFGQCLLSGKVLGSPMVTTDLATCSMAVKL